MKYSGIMKVEKKEKRKRLGASNMRVQSVVSCLDTFTYFALEMAINILL